MDNLKCTDDETRASTASMHAFGSCARVRTHGRVQGALLETPAIFHIENVEKISAPATQLRRFYIISTFMKLDDCGVKIIISVPGEI